MVRQSTTPLQVSAERFLTRRMMHALVRRDVAMHDDPLRAQSSALAAGSVLTAIVLAACVVFAAIRPHGLPDSAPILIARDSGALYVRIGDTLHPVMNLASARLVTRSPATPQPAGEAAIARAARGPLVGIAGAPSTIAPPLGDSDWTVCDDDRTVVTVGAAPGELDTARPVLVTPRAEGAPTTYLLFDGHRARVDLRDAAVIRALRLDGVVPVPVSRALLDIVPEVPAITAPRVEGAGGAGPTSLGTNTIGSVVRVLRADTEEYFVVLADGVQPVGDVAADLVRFTYGRVEGPVPVVAPAAIVATPVVRELVVDAFPHSVRRPVGIEDRVAVCATWRGGGHGRESETVVMTADSIASGSGQTMSLVQADGPGPNVDAVHVPPGRSAYVRSTGLAGDAGTPGARFLVTDAGVVFGVRDDDAAKYLGLAEQPGAAPWPILARLPRGPELSVDAASVVRDGLAAPS